MGISELFLFCLILGGGFYAGVQWQQQRTPPRVPPAQPAPPSYSPPPYLEDQPTPRRQPARRKADWPTSSSRQTEPERYETKLRSDPVLLNTLKAELMAREHHLMRVLNNFIEGNTGQHMQADPFYLYPEIASTSPEDFLNTLGTRLQHTNFPDLADDSKGWVYVLANYAMPGVVKIGYSTKPALRAAELSVLRTVDENGHSVTNRTSLPRPFKLQFCVLRPNARASEQYIHELLAPYNIREEGGMAGTEFFALSVEQAYDALYYTFPDDTFHFAAFHDSCFFFGRKVDTLQ
ncbi:GIY-YIG nuclease family protein [Nitratidesulfovibrio vulgaris]|uniref:GIY-YIG nuclease family protein n=1 Tax=Nitratidesulfovibrio vulgaris TaxID=881 RepID=UPI0023018301|nr:GIY-YIG nuclease family protein [Nitratidesulfovibrio vulgaris]WCB45250.1 GIY-YIG nuclease family protein [Nitratidesulfovibrio vulgaris]